eukprot:3460885-Amphidinium_carterae.1
MRYRDVNLPPAPRIFTSNAMEPCEWHADLPKNVFKDVACNRQEYRSPVKAVFKRVVFAHVTHSLISNEMRREWELRKKKRKTERSD